MRFSEIPYFILEKYISRFEETSDYSSTVSSKDLINPNFIFKDRNNIHYWESTNDFNWSEVEQETYFSNSYLLGPRTTIITTQGGIYLNIYIKNSENNYVPVLMKTKKIDGNRFHFTHIQNLNSPNELYNVVEGETFKFEIYDLWNNRIDIESGTDIYFRKDSVFHKWLTENASSIFEDQYNIEFVMKEYVNINKSFVYLGTITKNIGDEDEYLMIHYNIKDYVKDIVPPHQQTEKLKDFIYLAFDILYNRNYFLQKDTWNHIDPTECNEDLLDHLGTYYGFDLKPYFDEEDRTSNIITKKRWFLYNLPTLLKFKGSYTSLNMIWNSITYSGNRLNIYERWHDNSLTDQISASDYIDYLHTSFYNEADFDSGAGSSWYEYYYNDDNYPNTIDDKLLSTSYIVEPDITSYPVDNEKVLSEETIDTIYNLWKIFNPINRVPKYKMLLSPLSDISGNSYNLYSKEFIPYLESKSLFDMSFFSDIESGSFIEFINEKNVTIKHDLGSTNLLVEIYNTDYHKVESEKIDYIKIKNEDEIEVNLTEDIRAFVIIKRSNIYYKKDRFKHPFNTKSIITQFFNDNNRVIEPKNVELEDRRTINVFTEEVKTYSAYPAEYKEEFSNSNEWNVNHYLGYNCLLIDVLDENYFKIYPKSIKIVDENKVNIKFNQEKSGYVFITPIGNISSTSHNLNSTNIVTETYNHSNYKYNPDVIEIIDENNVEVDPYLGHISYYVGTVIDYEDITNNHIINFYKDNKKIYLNGDFSEDDYDKIVKIDSDVTVSQTTSSSAWNVQHDLGDKYILINVFNNDDNIIEPKEIEIIDENNCKIYFDDELSGYVNCAKPELIQSIDFDNYSYVFPSTSDSFSVNHELDTTIPIVQIYDENFNRIRPKYVDIEDGDTININLDKQMFSYTFIKGFNSEEKELMDYDWVVTSTNNDLRELTSQWYHNEFIKDPNYYKVVDSDHIGVNDEDINKSVLHSKDYYEEFNVESNTWNINHSLGSVGLIINTYNHDWERVYPKSIINIDTNNTEIKFDNPTKGHVLITNVGNPSFDLIADILDRSELHISSDLDDLETKDYIFNINNFRNETNNFYCEYIIPREISLNIKEMGIYDPEEERYMFYTECSDLYKHSEFEMIIFYRISKAKL